MASSEGNRPAPTQGDLSSSLECIDCGIETAEGVSCPRCRSQQPANDIGLALVREPVPKPTPKAKKRKVVRKRNHERAALMFDRNYGVGGRRGEAVRAMGCRLATHPLHTCEWKIDACHSTARGMGGTKGDSGDLWDGCRAAHREAGERGTSQRASFVERYSFDPEQRAAEVKAELDERFGPEPCYRCGETTGHTMLCSTAEGRRAARQDD